MLSGPFLSKDWMCATEDYETSDWVMIGLPYDGTCSNKPGTRFASQAVVRMQADEGIPMSSGSQYIVIRHSNQA